MDDLEGNAGADQTAAQNAGQNAGQTTAFSRFYKAPMGRVVRHLVIRKLGLIMPEAQPREGDQRLAVGIGYARPYLRFLDQRYGAVMGLQSAGIEPLAWPHRRPSRLASVEENALPLPSSGVDAVLLVHGLEIAPDPSALLQECWRVLKGMGRIVVVVPHRGSMWAGRRSHPLAMVSPIRSIKSNHCSKAMILRWRRCIRHLLPRLLRH